MTKSSELYLDKYQRNQYKSDILSILDLFTERIYPTFLNAEKEAEDYIESLYKDAMSQPSHGDIDDVAADIDKIQDRGYSKFQLLNLMHYRTIAIWISCMCQVWEQQLYSFVMQEAKRSRIQYDKSVSSGGFNFIKKVFACHNQSFEKMACWDKLNELRLLVNVIKHAEGNSEHKLRKMRPDLFISDFGLIKIDLLTINHSTLLEPTLHVCIEDFNVYCHSILSFWDELPDRMPNTFNIFT